MKIQVLPNLGIAMDRVSCPDTNIKVLTTRFPRASCFKETHVFFSRNMGVHVQCTCAKKLVSSNFSKIMHNYVRKKICSVVWPSVQMFGGVPRARMFWRFIITTKKQTYSFLEVSIGDIQEYPLGVYLGKESLYSILRNQNAIIFLLN